MADPAPQEDIVKRLRAACNGHPNAKIPWPHRVLHEAADEIERLRRAPSDAEVRAMALEECRQLAFDSTTDESDGDEWAEGFNTACATIEHAILRALAQREPKP